MNEINTKLKNLIIDKLEIPVYKFCKEIQVSRPTIENIMKTNEFTPSLITIKKICNYFNVDFHDYIQEAKHMIEAFIRKMKAEETRKRQELERQERQRKYKEFQAKKQQETGDRQL